MAGSTGAGLDFGHLRWLCRFGRRKGEQSRMNNALLYIGGLLVCVLAALFAVPHFVDWNSYRGVFEEEATRVLGRDVRIGGAVNLRLLPAPYVSLEKLKIADPSSVTGESLFRAESFTMWLSVPPLLKGVLEANKIEVRRPVIQLVSSPEGGGNWQTLSINPGQMPLIPKGVSLQSVTITEGALVMGTTARPEIARLESIDGEFTAEALNGPYKFSGTLQSGVSKVKREVRLATSAAESGQDLHFKVTSRTVLSGDTYTLSGRLSDVMGRAKVDGDLTAILNVTLFGAEGANNTPVPTSEVTAKISGDATGFEAKDITIALQQSATPQLVTGSAKVSWPERTRMEVALASRWLDFDQLSGGGKAVPLDIARQLFDALASILPDEADTNTKVLLDQVTLGGDAVSDVRFEASRAGGALELKDVRANLPGGARVEFDGQLTGVDAERAFNGMIALHGQSLQRFTVWGTGQPNLVTARADGPFALEGALSLSHSNISVRDATAEIAGMPLSGELTATLKGRRKISLVVEGDRLDAGAIWPGSLDPDFVVGLMRTPLAAPISVTPASPDAAKAPAEMDFRVRLRAGELADGARVLKNVDANFAIENGTLAMPKLNFTTADGLSVELEGETQTQNASAPVPAAIGAGASPTGFIGQVRGSVVAPDAAALTALSRALDFAVSDQAGAQNLSILAPLRIAGSAQFGTRAARSADIQFDGVAGEARVSGSMQVDGPFSDWRTSPGDVTLTAESGNIALTAAALLGVDAKLAAQDFSQPRAGRVQIKAVAGTGGGFLSNAAIRSEGLNATYNGTMSFDPKDGWLASGDVAVKADDARTVLALGGLRGGKGVGQVPLAGTIKVASSNGARTFTSEGVQLGNSKLSGRVVLSSAARLSGTEPASSFDANLIVDTAQVSTLLALLTSEVAAEPVIAKPVAEEKPQPTGRKLRALHAQQAQVLPPDEALQSVWPSQAFDTIVMSGLSGTIKASFGSLSLEPGLTLTGARLEAALSPDQIHVTRLEGKALGGLTTTALTLDKDPTGLKLSLALAVRAGGSSGSAATLKLDATGRGASPAGLIADLQGKGELALAEGAINVNAPASLTAIAEAALQGKGPVSGEELEFAVRAALKDTSQPLGALTIPLNVGDGVVRFDKVRIDAPKGRSQFDAVVELDTLKFDGQWQIEPKVEKLNPPGERMMLAPVSIVYAGKLKDIANLEPAIAIEGLERELSVRKMERDVEELEHLRKLDQAQAKAEQERRKALDAERIKASAAAKATRDAAAAAAAAGLPAPPAGQTQPPAPATPAGQSEAAPPADGTALPPDVAAQSDGDAAKADTPLADDAQAVSGVQAENATVDAVKSGASPPRPTVRRKRPAENPWQPFQTQPY